MLDGGSPATAELSQQVVVLNGQALIEAVHDPIVSPDTHAGLDLCSECCWPNLPAHCMFVWRYRSAL